MRAGRGGASRLGGERPGTFQPRPFPLFLVRLPALLLLLTVAGCGVLREPIVDTGFEVRRALAGLDTREATVDGRTVAYLERTPGGGAGPTVLLLHGFGTSKDAWVAFADALPDSFRVLAPDLAGHGGSVRDSAVAYDAPRLAAEVGAWLDAVAPGAAVHVAGNSLGGEVAALLALDRPARVLSLALFDPAGVDAPEPSALDSLGAAGAANPLIPTDRAGVDRLYDLVFVGDPGIPGAARDVLAADYARRAPFLRALFERIGYDGRDRLRPRLAEIRQPVLLVWGAEDEVIDPSAADVWAEGLPNATLRVLPGVGHVPMTERPDETAALFVQFVGGL